MSRSANERITVRLSANDLKGLDKIKVSGDFEDMSATLRWCIHFTTTMLRSIPAAIINSFAASEEEEKKKEMKKDDSLEVPPQEVPKPCNCGNGHGNC